MADRPLVEALFHEPSSTVSYIVACPETGRAAIVDPVLDYDIYSGRTETAFAERLVARVRERGLSVEWILETHVHADHLSAGAFLKQALGGRTAIGGHIVDVQAVFKDIYNLPPEFLTDGSQFDRLFGDEERFRLGQVPARVLHTPGHTPACVTYVIGDAAFTGDTVFMPDFGTARCDFPGGDAAALYRSVRRILALPPETRIFVGHDYAPGGRAVAWETTVAEERRANRHVRDGIDEQAFVAMRTERDKVLDVPALLLPSIQVNMRGGDLPEPESNGRAYLKIPLNAF